MTSILRPSSRLARSKLSLLTITTALSGVAACTGTVKSIEKQSTDMSGVASDSGVVPQQGDSGGPNGGTEAPLATTDGGATANRDATTPAAGDAQQPSTGNDAGSPPGSVVQATYPKDGFCNEGGVTWAWCEDFDGQGASGPVPFNASSAGTTFQIHSYMTLNGTTCESTKAEGKQCIPYVQGGSLFMNAEDSGFGMNVIRVEQPFDFAGREGHIHYRSDMRGHGRMHQTIHISPVLSNSMPDLRFVTVLEALTTGPALDLEFIGDGLQPLWAITWKGGQRAQALHGDGPLGTHAGEQHDLDFYVSRTRVRILLDGKQVWQQDLDDIGFDRGYVYFGQLAYNPVKDGFPGDAKNRFLWDNLAFDGPSLAKNSLTPADKQDILFRAYGKGSCTVRGVQADGPVAPTKYFMFDTWHAQLGINEPPVTLADINCAAIHEGGTPYGDAPLGDIQTIKR